MKLKKWMTLSNLLFTGSVLFALLVLLKTFVDKSRVPEGVCPITNNRSLLIISLVVLIIVTVITAMIDYKTKKN